MRPFGDPMRQYLYKVILDDGRPYRHYDYDAAVEMFEREGIKLYAYTKNLKPHTVLLKWK